MAIKTKTILTRFISGICLLVSFGAGIYAFKTIIDTPGMLFYSYDERKYAEICDLPSDTLVKYIFISQSNSLGGIVADFWLETMDRTPTDKLIAITRRDSLVQGAIKEALANNFNFEKLDSSVLESMVPYFEKIRRECSTNKRRSDFSERLNDFFQNIGLVVTLALLSWIMFRLVEKINANN